MFNYLNGEQQGKCLFIFNDDLLVISQEKNKDCYAQYRIVNEKIVNVFCKTPLNE